MLFLAEKPGSAYRAGPSSSRTSKGIASHAWSDAREYANQDHPAPRGLHAGCRLGRQPVQVLLQHAAGIRACRARGGRYAGVSSPALRSLSGREDLQGTLPGNDVLLDGDGTLRKRLSRLINRFSRRRAAGAWLLPCLLKLSRSGHPGRSLLNR